MTTKMKCCSPIKAVDVFCGIGGLTYGLRMAGIEVSAGLDVDPSCRYAYEENNSGTNFLSADIREIKFTDFEKFYEGSQVRVLVGCAPCQPFSAHTRRSGRDGNCELLVEFARLVREGTPHLVSIENVPGIVKHLSFSKLLRTLRSLNYNVDFDVVNFKQYGVPQNRRRLVLIASRIGSAKIPTPSGDTKNVADFIRDMPPIKAGQNCSEDSAHVTLPLSPTNLSRIQQSKPGGTWRDWDDALVNRCQKTAHYPGPYGRMCWDKPAPTLTTQFCYYSTGRFGHPVQNRTISIREAALLQTFPHDYKFVDPSSTLQINKLARHVGNAVPVKVGELIGRSLLNAT